VQEVLAELEKLDHLRHLDVARGINLRKEVREFEMELILISLKLTDGNQVRAASLLGMKPTTLNTKIKYHGIILKPQQE